MGSLIVLGPTVGAEAFVIVGLVLLMVGIGASIALAVLLVLLVPRAFQSRSSFGPLGSLAVAVVMAAPLLLPALAAGNGLLALAAAVTGIFGFFPALFFLDAEQRIALRRAARNTRPAPPTP